MSYRMIGGETDAWENVYSGFDRKAGKDFAGAVVEDYERVLPTPVISPTCAKRGHDWTKPHTYFPREYFKGPTSYGRACKRCAKRGLLVIRTEVDFHTESATADDSQKDLPSTASEEA